MLSLLADLLAYGRGGAGLLVCERGLALGWLRVMVLKVGERLAGGVLKVGERLAGGTLARVYNGSTDVYDSF